MHIIAYQRISALALTCWPIRRSLFTELYNSTFVERKKAWRYECLFRSLLLGKISVICYVRAKEGDARWKKRTCWLQSLILTCCASTTKPMPRSKARPGDERSTGPAGEKASWKSEQRPVTNGCSPLHGSSGSIVGTCLFGIWLRILDKSEFVFFAI